MGKKNSAKGIVVLFLLAFLAAVRIVYINLPVNVPKDNDIYTMHKVGESIDLGEGKFFVLSSCEPTQDASYLEDGKQGLNREVLMKLTIRTNVDELVQDFRFKLYDRTVGICYVSDPYNKKGGSATFDIVLHIEKEFIQFLREHDRPRDLYFFVSPDPYIHEKETISCIKMNLEEMLKK
ncbi:MAG: hypothetical protein SOW18_05925 [Peptoniphilus sp.]|nr:hypothetical protein [Peptoniphilus sp.]MDY3119055.1 hypothetical protein [Peptoniphilus sp.]